MTTEFTPKPLLIPVHVAYEMIVYESELPEDMPSCEYDSWFDMSWLYLGVRMGPRPPCMRDELEEGQEKPVIQMHVDYSEQHCPPLSAAPDDGMCCGERLESGYGMAGGGMGPYYMCNVCGQMWKDQDEWFDEEAEKDNDDE